MRYRGVQSFRALKRNQFAPPLRTSIDESRAFSSSGSYLDTEAGADLHASQEAAPPPTNSQNPFNLPSVDPNSVYTRRDERIAVRLGTPPIGSRRRRAAIHSNTGIPFEHLPYQCFQEARKVLLEDRAEKLGQIAKQRARLEYLKTNRADLEAKQGPHMVTKRLDQVSQHLHHLKILADINDPLVKKKYEDDLGDFTRPIYRHYAETEWRKQRYLILMQRLTQMNVIPDVVSTFDQLVDMQLLWGRKKIPPGAKVASMLSETPPKVIVQPFDKGERLVTIAVVDPDVPNAETNTFDSRTHFVACNIPVSPTNTSIDLADMQSATPRKAKGDIVQEWIPPTAEKGAPYHRLCVVVMEQPENKPVDIDDAKKHAMGTWHVRKFMSMRHMKPVGIYLFRTEWDEYCDVLSRKLGVKGGNLHFKHKRAEPLPYRRKPSDSERYR